MSGFHLSHLFEVALERGHAAGSGTLNEGLGGRTQGTEGFLRCGLRPHGTRGHGTGPAIVLVENGGLTRGNEEMLSHNLAQEHHENSAVLGDQLDLATDVDVGHRIAGRAEADTAESIDLAHHQLSDLGSQQREGAHQFTLFVQAIERDGTDLRVQDGVHLVAPEQAFGVGAGEVGDAEFFGDHEIGLA